MGVLTRLLVSELSCLCINGLVHKSMECIAMIQVEITTQLGVKTLPEPTLVQNRAIAPVHKAL